VKRIQEIENDASRKDGCFSHFDGNENMAGTRIQSETDFCEISVLAHFLRT